MPLYEVILNTEWRVEVNAKSAGEAEALAEAFMEPGPDNILYQYSKATELED